MALDRGSVAHSTLPETSAALICTSSGDNGRLDLPSCPTDQSDLVDTCPCASVVVDGNFAVCVDCGTGYELFELTTKSPPVVFLNIGGKPWAAIEEPRGPSAHLQGEA